MAGKRKDRSNPSAVRKSRGKPKRQAKPRLMATDTAIRVLNDTVTVKEGDKLRQLNTVEAALFSLFKRAGKGDFSVQKELIQLGDRVGVQLRVTLPVQIRFFERDEAGRLFEVNDPRDSEKRPVETGTRSNRVPACLLREQRLMEGAPERDQHQTGDTVYRSTRQEAAGGHYEVGYKRPPKSGQIKPGEVRNPYGRGGKHKRPWRTVDDLIESFLVEECTIIEGGVPSSMPRYEAVLRMTRNIALNGNSAASRFIIDKSREIRILDGAKRPIIINIEFVESDGNGRPKEYPPATAA